jgi:hypothetical protein
VDWNRLLFHRQLTYYLNHVFRDASHFHQLHLNLIFIFNASRNQHFDWLDWNRLLFHHQLKYYVNHVFRDASHFHQLHLKFARNSYELNQMHFTGVQRSFVFQNTFSRDLALSWTASLLLQRDQSTHSIMHDCQWGNHLNFWFSPGEKTSDSQAAMACDLSTLRFDSWKNASSFKDE